MFINYFLNVKHCLVYLFDFYTMLIAYLISLEGREEKCFISVWKVIYMYIKIVVWQKNVGVYQTV